VSGSSARHEGKRIRGSLCARSRTIAQLLALHTLPYSRRPFLPQSARPCSCCS
jgi:hypothetical protein